MVSTRHVEMVAVSPEDGMPECTRIVSQLVDSDSTVFAFTHGKISQRILGYWDTYPQEATTIVLDRPSRISTNVMAMILCIAQHDARVVIVDHDASFAQDLAAFLDTTLVIRHVTTVSRSSCEVQHLPWYSNVASRAAAELAWKIEEGGIVIFVSNLKAAEVVQSRLRGISCIIHRGRCPPILKRVLIVTLEGIRRLIHRGMGFAHVIDACPETNWQGRAVFAIKTYRRLYTPDKSIIEPSFIQPRTAVGLATMKGFPLSKDMVFRGVRFIRQPIDTLVHLRLDSTCHALLQFKYKWAARLAAILHDRKVYPKDLFTYESDREFAMPSYKMFLTITGYNSIAVDEFKHKIRHLFPNAIYRRVQGSWFMNVTTGNLLRISSESSIILVLGESPEGFNGFTSVSSWSVPTLTRFRIRCSEIPFLERFVLLHQTEIPGAFLQTDGKRSVKVVCPSSRDVRPMIEAWLEQLHQKAVEACHEISTTQGLRLVVSTGGSIQEVLHKREYASVYIPQLIPSLLHGMEKVRVVPGTKRQTTVVTLRKPNDATLLMKRCAAVNLSADPTMASPSLSPKITCGSKIVFVLRWAEGPSMGTAIVTRHVESCPWDSESREGKTILSGIPMEEDEVSIARKLSVDETDVTVQRLEGPRIPNHITSIMPPNVWNRLFARRILINDKDTVSGRTTISFVLPDIRTAVEVAYAIKPKMIHGQPLRAYFHIKPVLSNAAIRTLALLGRPSPTDEVFLMEPVANAVARLHDCFGRASLLESQLRPTIFYHPTFTRLRGIPSESETFVEHKHQSSPIIKIYGRLEAREQRRKSLLDRIHETTGNTSRLCIICRDVPPDYTLFSCGHDMMCKACLCLTINEQAQHRSLFTCPLPECGQPMAWHEIQDMCSPEAMDVWKLHQLSRLENQQKVRTCPGDCGTFVLTRDADTFTCSTCLLCWCLLCRERAHQGPCDPIERSKDLSELAKLGVVPCPSCFIPVEKIEGCSHIRCKCSAHWCWGCGKEFDLASFKTSFGQVEWINHDFGTVVVKITSWTGSCPSPDCIVLKNYGEQEYGDLVAVDNDIYDHVNSCGRPLHQTT